jgi:hypothetical protein
VRTARTCEADGARGHRSQRTAAVRSARRTAAFGSPGGRRSRPCRVLRDCQPRLHGERRGKGARAQSEFSGRAADPAQQAGRLSEGPAAVLDALVKRGRGGRPGLAPDRTRALAWQADLDGASGPGFPCKPRRRRVRAVARRVPDFAAFRRRSVHRSSTVAWQIGHRERLVWRGVDRNGDAAGASSPSRKSERCSGLNRSRTLASETWRSRSCGSHS